MYLYISTTPKYDILTLPVYLSLLSVGLSYMCPSCVSCLACTLRTHAGVLVPMDMTPDTKTTVPTAAAGSSQAV